MPNFDLVFGGFKQKDYPDIENYIKEITTKNCSKKDIKPTYYANTNIFSTKSPRKYPTSIGKLAENVFNDEGQDLFEYKLYGTMNLFNISPNFILPVFEYNGKYYFQNSDNNLEIDSFFEVVGDNHISHIRPLSKSYNKLINIKDFYTIGDEPIVAFQLDEDCIYIGDMTLFSEFIQDKKMKYSDMLRQDIVEFQNQIKNSKQLKKIK